MSRRILNLSPARDQAEPELAGELLAAAKEADLDRVEALAARLWHLDPAAIEGDPTRIAFWVNLYNALFRHEVLLRPRRGKLWMHLRLFAIVSYRVGDQAYSLDESEHGVLRRNRRSPYRLRSPFRSGDPRLASLPGRRDPGIHFALNCGAASCPPIRAYSAEGLDGELRLATASYMASEVEVDAEAGRVRLPALMRAYGVDFGGKDERLRLAAEHLSGERAEFLAAQPDELKVAYRGYDQTVVAPDAAR